MNLNKVFIVGRLTAKPELKSTPGGQSVTSFNIATNRTWTDKAGAKQEQSEFHACVAWAKTAELVTTYMKKGSEMLVEGRLQTRKWDDKQGVKHWKTEIVVESIQFGSRPAGGSKPAPVKQEEEVPVINVGDDEEINASDLPF